MAEMTDEQRRALSHTLGRTEYALGLPIAEPWQEDDPSATLLRQLKYVICPQCRQPFRLIWDDSSDRSETVLNGSQYPTLRVYGCPSGGTYAVEIHCPHCTYEEEL